jgi:hypothetical protein
LGAIMNAVSLQLKSACALLLAATSLPASAATYTFVVAGLGGEPAYEQKFREHAAAVVSAAEKAAGSTANVISLTGDAARAVAVRREFKTLAGRMSADDSAVVVLIGHGSYDGEDYRLNLPGPDLTDTELARLFDELPARDQLIINGTSASGAVFDALCAKLGSGRRVRRGRHQQGSNRHRGRGLSIRDA